MGFYSVVGEEFSDDVRNILAEFVGTSSVVGFDDGNDNVLLFITGVKFVDLDEVEHSTDIREALSGDFEEVGPEFEFVLVEVSLQEVEGRLSKESAVGVAGLDIFVVFGEGVEGIDLVLGVELSVGLVVVDDLFNFGSDVFSSILVAWVVVDFLEGLLDLVDQSTVVSGGEGNKANEGEDLVHFFFLFGVRYFFQN